MNAVADFNNDDWLQSEVLHDASRGALILRLQAKQAIRIVEVQGSATDVDSFGLKMPEGFRKMTFGEGVKIPDEIKRELEHMNRLNFRWGCDLPMKAGASYELAIPASGPGKERIVITLAYEYPRLLGLLKRKNGFRARMTPKP